jgi:glycosyltransferase involved in cell wall biosynthesis
MLSIVMPAYNEAAILERSIREWYEVIDKLEGAELLIVDDCSTDDTASVLNSLSQTLPRLRALQTPQNGGHGRAVLFGIQNATKPFVFHTDSDRQHTPVDFWTLWELRDHYDFIFGVREQRADGMFRLFVTRTMRLILFLFWGKWIRDANCPFKLMRTEALRSVLSRVPSGSFIPMVMVALLARTMGYRTTEVEIQHFNRKGGQQSLHGFIRWLRIGTRCVMELLTFRISLSDWSQPNAEERAIASRPIASSAVSHSDGTHTHDISQQR